MFSFLFLGLVNSAVAQEKQVNVYMFTRDGCPHCAAEKEFFKDLLAKDAYKDVKVHEFEIMSSPKNAVLLNKVGRYFKVDVGGVPFTVVGSKNFVGYLNDATTGKQIEDAIIEVQKGNDSDAIYDIIKGQLPKEQREQSKISEEARKLLPDQLAIPLIGSISLKNLSLPALTVVIALFDGFNPCAMWVLLFLISMLLGMGDRKRIWLLGGSFILASGVVYFLLLSAWLNLFLFIGFALWIRIFIGLFAIIAGAYSLKKVIDERKGGCEVVNTDKRRQIFERIKSIIQKEQLILALAGIVMLAFAINIVEALCSAGLPAIYTKVLTMSNLPALTYYMYLLLYVFIFLIDDLFVFLLAVTTLKTFGIESKYARYSHIIGGIVMLIVGVLMIVKPELLSFGSF
jgi:glutaredoxin